MNAVMVKAFIKKCPDQDNMVATVRTVLKPFAPLYSVHRRCVSGDIDYRAVVMVIPETAEDIKRALWLEGIPASLVNMGEA